MNTIEVDSLEILEFEKVKHHVSDFCYSKAAKQKVSQISVIVNHEILIKELYRVFEIKNTLASDAYFPDIKFDDFLKEASLLSLQGSMLTEEQFLILKKSTEIANTIIRFLKSKKIILPHLLDLVEDIDENRLIITEIDSIIDFDATVKTSASKELQKIRKELSEKKRESDTKFYRYITEFRKQGFLRENEEGFFNGRRTLAVLVEHKSEINGFVHSKSETGKTIFIEPSGTISVNNDIAELEIDERREVNRILRVLTETLRPFSNQLKNYYSLLIELDFLMAKTKFALKTQATLPLISKTNELKLIKAYHPILFIQNKELNKPTIPLNVELDSDKRIILISGPNAGGKSVTIKTIGLLQVMLQCGLLVSVNENSVMCFFKNILIDIGDSQSIEHELSTYSSRLKKMVSILNTINLNTLVLIDEFGSGTDPELGGAMAEVVMEELVKSNTLGVITTHFSNLKLLANNLQGVVNGSMLFDIKTLEPKYLLSVGEPGSSYTFEVAERVGFPKQLIERAKLKIDSEKVDLNALLADVQQQKTNLAELIEKTEHQEFLSKISKEKYDVLYVNWKEKIERERDRKIELARLAEFGQKYLRLMDEWNKNEDRKFVIKRFIDGITAETNKRKELAKQQKVDKFAEKKIARLTPLLKVGSKVKILNGNEIGIVNTFKDGKVNITFGALKLTVNIENLELVRD